MKRKMLKKESIYRLAGSISPEAAIVTAVFLFSVLLIAGLLNLISLQQSFRRCMENIGRRMAQTIYYEEELYEVGKEMEPVQKITELLNEKLESISEEEKKEMLEIVNKASFDLYIYGRFAAEMKNINSKYIVGGMAGLDFSESQYDKEEGRIDIVLKYVVRVPYISEKIFYFGDCQRVSLKVWNGKDITLSPRKVYITKYGEVYHTKENCSHIELSLQKVAYSEIESLRNKSGSKYESCSICAEDKESNLATVYITEYGESFHTTLECSGISRSVMAVDEEAVGDRKMCQECQTR